MANSLFEDEGADEVAIRVNTAFAEKYEYRKKREELSRLKDKYGEELEEEESSSEEEDEDAELLTPDVDADILRTLSLIKSRDPRIYDKDAKFYEEKEAKEEEEEEGAKPQKEKKMTLKDYERRELLTKGAEGAFNSDSEDEHVKKKKGKSYLEEQAELKESLKKSLAAMDGSDDDEGLFEVRVKTQEEEDVEHEGYLRWLRGEEEKVKNRKVAEMETLKRYWTDPNLDPNERFLRDYVLSKGWVDKDDEPARRAPRALGEGETVDDEEDAEAVDAMDAFEAKYNFRYAEEPDDRRKLERERKKEAKKKEQAEKKEELKRLKNLKKQEIADKLKKIEELTGTHVEGIDLEADFDPAAYEHQMQAVFNAQYYEADDDEKPVFDDDPLLDVEDWEGELEGDYAPEIEGGGEEEEKKKKKKKKKKEEEEGGAEAEDGDFNMDADYEDTKDTAGDAPVPARPLSKAAKKKQKKLLGRLLKNIEDTRQTPAYDPASGLSFDQYLEEYYRLDYEDMIGDMPVRFKYRQVVPNDYGLNASEVLKADDRELNQWASLRNITKYRPMKVEKKDVEKYKDIPTWKKAKVVPSALKGYKKKQPARDQKGEGEKKKKKKTGVGEGESEGEKNKKKKGEGEKEEEGKGVKEEAGEEASAGAEGETKKKRKKKKKKPAETEATKEEGTKGATWSREAFNSKLVGDDRLAAYGVGTAGAKRPAKGSKSARPVKKQRKE